MRAPALLTLAAAGALAAVPAALGGHGGGGGTPFSTQLTGAAEVPGPGDPDGSGAASLRLNQGQGEVCFSIDVTGVDTITAAHIHAAPAGVAGPVVVPLPPVDAEDGSWSGCTTGVSKGLVKAIRQNPEDYYVNVHNPAFPAGALRGQLG